MTPVAGMVLCAIGIALMCGMDAVAKALGAELTTFQVVFLRYLGASVWLALWITARGEKWPQRSNLARHAQRALLLVVTASSFFHAVTHLPLAVVAALAMTAPIYVTVLGAVAFKEKISATGWMALAIGVAGSSVIVLAGQTMGATGLSGDPLAWAAAFIAPMTYALTVAVLKHHAKNEEPAAMTLGQSMLAALIVLPLAGGVWPQITPHIAGLGVLIGLLGALGFLLLIHGLRHLPINAFAILDYTGLLWAGLLGFVFFSEVPGIQLWIGGGLIIAACALSLRSGRERSSSLSHN